MARVVAEAVSRWPSTVEAETEAGVRSRVSVYGIFGGQSDTGAGFRL
jgi:hypothetical protein